MMGRLPGLLLLLAVLGLCWLFWQGDSPPESASELAELELEWPEEAEPAVAALPTDVAEHSSEAGGVSPDPAEPPIEPAAAKPDSSSGVLELRVTDKEGQLLGPEGVTARIHYVRRPDRSAIFGVVAESGAIFRFGRVPPGTVRVHVDGDHVRPGMVRATIRGGATTRRSLSVGRAGAVQYDIQFADGSRPKSVQLSLLAADEKPVRAWYRPRTGGDVTVRTQRGRTVRVPPAGVIYALEAGTYTLKAVAQGGVTGNFIGAQSLGVRVGSTASVIVLLER